MITVDLLTIARKINNYAEDAGGGGLFTDTTHYKVVVPVGKRWFFMGGGIKRDASETVKVWIFNSADKYLMALGDFGAGTALVSYPEPEFQWGIPIILDAGEYISMTFGGVQGGSAYASCVVLEVDV